MIYKSLNVNYKLFLLHMFLDPSLRYARDLFPTPIGQHLSYSLVNTHGLRRTHSDLN